MKNTGKYNALQIAKYIISHSNSKGHPISNLQLQKILYFAWRDYYKETKKHLFSEPIEAWQYGHVVPCVYNQYSKFSAIPLKFDFDINLSGDEDILNKTIENYFTKRISELINESHAEGNSWNKNFSRYSKNIIPFDDIISLDCK